MAFSASLLRYARHATILSGGTSILFNGHSMMMATKCEQEQRVVSNKRTLSNANGHAVGDKRKEGNSDTDDARMEEWYANIFPKRQLHVPTKAYPLWDSNWDHKQPTPLADTEDERKKLREIRKHGTTRHIILVRHGQYDETHKEDEKRILTSLGREQADLTGKRIAEMIRGEMQRHDATTTTTNTTTSTTGDDGGDCRRSPCRVKILRVSNLARAKETADIIARHLDESVEIGSPDPLLNEARPCHTIPGSRASPSAIQKIDEGHAQVEAAFRKYFYRSDYSDANDNDHHPDATTTIHSKGRPEPTETHEFEIVVCHANVIRYFLCRALQLPPEAWLRFCNFNCSLTYLTIRPTGSVSCRMFGDVGHLPYSKCTFSQHHGFNW
jgi:serine/threonine-protein phosphatase PGAM5